jgi:hypothetical protein
MEVNEEDSHLPRTGTASTSWVTFGRSSEDGRPISSSMHRREHQAVCDDPRGDRAHATRSAELVKQLNSKLTGGRTTSLGRSPAYHVVDEPTIGCAGGYAESTGWQGGNRFPDQSLRNGRFDCRLTRNLPWAKA